LRRYKKNVSHKIHSNIIIAFIENITVPNFFIFKMLKKTFRYYDFFWLKYLFFPKIRLIFALQKIRKNILQ